MLGRDHAQPLYPLAAPAATACCHPSRAAGMQPKRRAGQGEDGIMTAPARISQADMDRVAKSVRNAGFSSFRIRYDFKRECIEAVIGDHASAETLPEEGHWDDDDI